MTESIREAIRTVKREYAGTYEQELFDPVQTHGMYGLTEKTLPKVKEMLKNAGAKRFRTVKIRSSDRCILCFKA